jgi:molybdenum cofactor cytidylyltransferase
MGRSKPLLPCPPGGAPFIVTLARSLESGGTNGILVVGREDDEELRQVVLTGIPGARFVVNRNADSGGMLSSLLAGLDAIDGPGVRGVMMAPVDVPRVDAATVAALLAAFRSTPGRIVRAVHAGRHGHPVIFPRELFHELRRADPARGAKAVVRAHEAAVVDVDVPDPAVIEDFDTQDDYDRAFQR